MKTISAIVLVGGDYDKSLFEKCLDSLDWTDEILKVETKSLDGGFSEWRNWGAKMAVGQWLLYVDVDEEITPALKKEIRDAVDSGEHSAYAIPRKNILLGKELVFGGWSPDYVLRLINKETLLGWEGELHEQPKIKGTVGHMKEKLLHTSHRHISEMIQKTNKWSQVEANLLFDSGHPRMNILRFFSAGFREFWYRGVRKQGFLDGTIGAVEVFYQVISRFVTYTKLWEMQLNKTK